MFDATAGLRPLLFLSARSTNSVWVALARLLLSASRPARHRQITACGGICLHMHVRMHIPRPVPVPVRVPASLLLPEPIRNKSQELLPNTKHPYA